VRARYGASPLHLLAHLAAFALVAWALLQALQLGGWQRIVLWLAGAVVLHDAVLWPAYTALDRLGRTARPNYVRVPLGISALLLLVFFPVVCGKGDRTYARVSGLEWQGYAGRWLLVSAALFVVSGALYVIRGRSAGARRPPSR
jgi:hypothetical protein